MDNESKQVKNNYKELIKLTRKVQGVKKMFHVAFIKYFFSSTIINLPETKFRPIGEKNPKFTYQVGQNSDSQNHIQSPWDDYRMRRDPRTV